MNNFKKVIQFIINTIAWIFVTLFIAVLLFSFSTNLNVAGGYKMLIVQSGSMEPTIMTGDVIIIGQTNNYVKNDVVTFTDKEFGVTTHRIIEIKESQNTETITTKGDANRAQDSDTITKDMILGKVILTLPKFGYFVNFVRSKVGLVIFLIIPAVAIAVDEFIKIVKTTKPKNSEENRY